MSEGAATLCLVSILLIPFAGAGLALINTGLSRSRSAAHSMLASLCVLAVGAIAYFVCGFAFTGYAGSPAHVVTIAGKPWDLLAARSFFLRDVQFNGSTPSLSVLFGMFAAGLVPLIALGAGAERWRLGSACACAAALSAFTWPLFAHWVWGGGWLSQLGLNYGLGGGFLDTGGAGCIQVVGGLAALSVAWILGPRRGRYALHGMPTAIPGHNAVLVLLGCMVALIGWQGLNCAGALLFAGIAPGQLTIVPVNTILSAAAGALAALAITRLRFGKPDASLTANGWVSGLVASSAGCALEAPLAGAVTGLLAGALVVFSVELFELRLSVDDPAGAVSVHAVGGIWGLIAAGMFAHTRGSGQFLAQLVGIATLLGFVLPLTFGVNALLNRLWPWRVSAQGEREGLDLHELGAGAYPEFVTHRDEYGPR